MDYRSYLFVPADQPRKLERAAESPTDAMIIDLEDAVGAPRKEEARECAAAFMSSHRGGGPACLVRVNALSTGMTDRDVAMTVRQRPAGYVLPKCEGVADIDALARLIVQHGGGDIPILAIATETVRAVRSLMRTDWAHPALGGLTWGGEDLLADIGAMRNRDDCNAYMTPFRLARDLTLFAALEAGVAPVDAVYTNFRDTSGLAAECRAAAEVGFVGKMAIHPAQIAPIHEAYCPSADQISWAQRVQDALTRSGGGATSLDGEMLDIPHRRRAERILARAEGTVQRQPAQD